MKNHNSNAWLNFNIHDLVKFKVAEDAPTSALFADMFRPFRVDEDLEEVDLVIDAEFEPLVDGAYGEAHGESDFYYNEKGLHLESADIQIFKNGSGFSLKGKIELLVMALPLIDRIMVTKGAAMIHALTVAYRGQGVCIPAWGGTGKTSTIAKLAKIDGFSFMGDDWAFLTRDSQMLAYAKPMFIKPYHRSIYPHLFKTIHKPLVPVRLSKTISRLTTKFHPFVTKFPRLASISRRWSPEHMMVTPEQAFPDFEFTEQAPLAVVLFVERFKSTSDAPVFEEHDTDWMVSRVIGNFNSEMTKHSRLVMTVLGAAGIVPIEQAFIEKAEVLSSAISGKRCFLLRVPQHLPPDAASDIIVAHILKVNELAGIR